MNEKSMRSCVRVLRIEAKWRYILSEIIYKLIDCVPSINWCIIRSIWRWIGIPLVFALAFVTIDVTKLTIAVFAATIAWLVPVIFVLIVLIVGSLPLARYVATFALP